MTKALIAAACLMTAGLFSGTASAQDIFVKFAGMPGTSAMVNRGDWIEAMTFSEGVSVGAPATAGAATRVGGKATFDRVTLVKTVDAATLQLREAAAAGRVISKVEIEVQQSAGKAMTFYKVTLNNVLVQSVNTSFSEGGSGAGEESVSLAFEEIRWEFTPVDSKDGKAKEKVTGGWSVTTNRKL